MANFFNTNAHTTFTTGKICGWNKPAQSIIEKDNSEDDTETPWWDSADSEDLSGEASATVIELEEVAIEPLSANAEQVLDLQPEIGEAASSPLSAEPDQTAVVPSSENLNVSGWAEDSEICEISIVDFDPSEQETPSKDASAEENPEDQSTIDYESISMEVPFDFSSDHPFAIGADPNLESAFNQLITCIRNLNPAPSPDDSRAFDVSSFELHEAKFLFEHAERAHDMDYFKTVREIFDIKHKIIEQVGNIDSICSPNLDALLDFAEQKYFTDSEKGDFYGLD